MFQLRRIAPCNIAQRRVVLHHPLPHQLIQRVYAFPLPSPRPIHRKRPSILAIEPPPTERQRVERPLQMGEKLQFALRSTKIKSISARTALGIRSWRSTRSATSCLPPWRRPSPCWRTFQSRRSRLPPFGPHSPRTPAESPSTRGSSPSPSSVPTDCGSEPLHHTWKPWKPG